MICKACNAGYHEETYGAEAAACACPCHPRGHGRIGQDERSHRILSTFSMPICAILAFVFLAVAVVVDAVSR